MVTVEFTVEVERAVHDVFVYLTDPENLPEWQSGALEAHKVSEGPMGEGARWREVRKFLGRRLESALEVTAYELDRRFDVRAVSGPVPFHVHHTLEPVDGRTRIRFVGEGEPGGFFRLAEPIVTRAAKREFERDFETLKDVLESR